jgi:hypothetical protein
MPDSNPVKELTDDELLKPALVSIVLEALNASLHPLLPGQISCTQNNEQNQLLYKLLA